MELILKLTKNLILFLDGDVVGINETSAKINDLIEYGFESVYVINIKDKDPDDIALEQKENLRIYIETNKVDFYVYLLDQELAMLRQNMYCAGNKSRKKMKEILNLIKDETTRQLCQDQFIKTIMEESTSDK